MPNQHEVENAIKAAFEGPEIKGININGPKFNVKPMAIHRSGNSVTAQGRISHHIKTWADDQVDYTLRIIDGVPQKPEISIDAGGFSKFLATIAPFVPKDWTKNDIVAEEDVLKALKDAESLLAGGWQGSVKYLLALFMTKLASGYSMGQMSSALTASKKPLPTYKVQGLIKEKWIALGSENGFLGYPVTDELVAPDGIGRFSFFQGGAIYWTPATGAFEVHGLIREKWGALGWEKSFLGYPVTDELVAPDGIGRFSFFQGGAIYWTPATGAFEVHGLIREKWVSSGSEGGSLGYPISDERDLASGGRVSNFQHGRVTWTSKEGARVLMNVEVHA